MILIGGCLLAALFLAIFFAAGNRAGSEISISCDGVELYRVNLQDANRQTQYYLIEYHENGQDVHIMHYEQYPELPASSSYNLFAVADGQVTMEAADCRDQICVRHVPIKNDRENIICLPHKLVIELNDSTKLSLPDSEDGEQQYRDGGKEEAPLDGVAG